MRKKEAETLIGKNVKCRTSLNGDYIGELIEVFGSPWRGKVKILAVIEYPVQGLSEGSMGFKARKPYGFMEIKDFGNSSIKLYKEEVPDYNTSLIQALKNKISATESTLEYCKSANMTYGLELKALEVLKERLKELE